MSTASDTVEVKVEVSHDEDYGTVYVATNDRLGLVTDGTTFETLLDNLREALALCLADAAELGIVPNPRIVITMEMPADAQTA